MAISSEPLENHPRNADEIAPFGNTGKQHFYTFVAELPDEMDVKFQNFKIWKFQNFKISKFQYFKHLQIHNFKNPKFQTFTISKFTISKCSNKKTQKQHNKKNKHNTNKKQHTMSFCFFKISKIIIESSNFHNFKISKFQYFKMLNVQNTLNI